MWSFSFLLFWGCCGIYSWGMFTSPSLESMTRRERPRRSPSNLDAKGCTDTTTCPAHATCTNTSTSYYCACKRGFLSSNGLKTFKGPGVECKDIDECSQRPTPCGPNSICRNLPGRYRCSCRTGFSSPTGNNWMPGKRGHFTCKDVDECVSPRSCPEHSTCHNSVGSYSCVCNPGYVSRSGKKSFQGLGETCQDIDECSQKPPPCGPNSVCRNLPGKYECSCLTGFSSPTGNNWIPGKPGHFSCTDINECLSRGVCPEHSECTNSLGSYRCSCKVGFTSKNSICEDVDECANSRSCPEHSTCHNSVGSYSCVCNPGYVSKSGKKSFQGPGETCQDIDECSQKPPPCGPNSVCRNLPGKYECSCLTGFSSPTGNNWIPGKPGHFSCTDINECLSRGVCPEHSECTNSLGSYRCSCKVGFTSKNSICEDVDECANSRSCPEHSTCHNSVGSYSCVCNPGYVSKSGKKSFQGPGETCQDIDECSQKPPPCGPNSVCRNLPGKYECSCLTGFSSPTGNNWIPGKPGHFSCTDINECLSRGVCPEHSECTNSLGSYRCSCKVGFTSKNSICEDVDECANSRSCPEHSTCHNSVGSYSCVCNPGYVSKSGKKSFQGPGETCQDIDECSQKPPPCGPNSVCRNLPGKYECSCLTGFSSPTGNNWIPGKPGHFSCTDINECLSRGVCPEHSECTNSLGSYRCSCKVGFTSKNSICEDVDECANSRSCPEHSTCHNSVGSYSCVCNPGYVSKSGKKSFQGPGETCQDIDECSQKPPPCGPNSVCRNLPGKYECSCLTGFSSPTGNNWIPGKPGHFSCTDINECLSRGVCPEHSECTNSLGSYHCTCKVGFTSKNSICEDVDECANSRSCPEHSTCHNSVGSYSCVCNPGYVSKSGKKSFQGPGETCQDIDECSQKPPPCGPNSVCRNLPGKYECSCLTGFSSPTGNNWIPGKPGHFSCTDINECLSRGVCPEHSECTNSLGSYRCSCKVGFTSKNSSCEDVDECANSRSCPEHSTCHNSVGSYSCVCNPGYVSKSGKKSFQGPGETCQDIDECSQKPPPCGPNSVCRNLPGKYECSCLTGFSSPTGNNWIPGKPGHFSCTDINECLSRGVCPEHSECTNSLGSYRCSCKVGFTSKNSSCEDVDECANSRSCPEHSTCHNSVGSYSCVCNPGYVSKSGKKSFQGPGETCQDIDECSQKPPPCGPNSVCRNLPGKYECSCLTGFSSPTGNNWIPGKPGHFSCTDINECLSRGVCPEHSECTNSLGSYRCSCKVGFTSKNSSCEDVDECANSRSCPEHSTCHNSVGSYSCVCNPGYVSKSGKKSFQGPGETCQDIDECSQKPPPCGPNSVCRNLPGKYECSCLTGFSSPTGNNWIPGKPGHFSCTDINECLSRGVCPEHSECTNSLGSYHCTCKVGFTSKNSICEDVDECANSRSCPEHSTCHNSVGSYSCVCNPGYVSKSGKKSFQGPGETCQDIDECSQKPPPCGPNSVCRNLPGKYECSCLTGFSSPTGNNWIPGKPGHFSCTDINECLSRGVCPEHSECTNSLGSYRCSCKVGFTSKNSSCEDVDECANSRSCPEHSTCHNSVGSYSCVCNPGYVSKSGKKSFQGPGETCQDIDECSQKPPPCGPNSVCRNLPGKYECSCLTGFSSPTGNNWIPGKPGHFSCTDINECLSRGVCPEHSECTNSLGSYRCSCKVGFTSKNSSCEDVDECANSRSCPEHSTCHNSVGSYSCVCNPGYVSKSGKKSFQGPGETCQDIDECSQKPPPCGPNSVCRNLPGKYECSCLTGFSSPTGNNWIPGKPGHFSCTDINECLSRGVCPEHSECTNSLGSYRCSCKVGFTSKNSSCEDVDECANSRSCPEHSTCHNSVGSYSCVCNPGYVSKSGKKSFQGPGETCQDIDECSQKPPPCGPNSVCRNLPGKYECSCLTGFSSPTGNNWIPGKPGHFSCTDINECLSRGVCPEHSECTNSLGSYRCSCKVGFTSKNSSCEDVDECANSRSCPEHSTCHNSVGSYSCVCNPGYVSKSGKKSFQGPGETCQDIDECSQKPPPCGPNSVCRNLPGKYECSCLTGFSSPTGNNWIPGKPGHFSCTDINECLSRGVCPEHSECTNSLGSYRCSCKVGFTSKNSSCEDVDECANSRSCPEHSTCHNSVGSYSCVCNPGYVSKSGKKSFQGPGETCQDIDECSQKPPPCGPNSVCRNLPGKYECSCLTGFSSPTGNNWIPGKPGHFSCTDINECLSRGVCPEHSECTNSLGSYRCSCKVGFTSKNSSCEDVDECANSRSCPEHSTCHNSVGSYSCVCNPGYVSKSGKKSFQGPGETCQDIDECSQKPPPCGPNSVCRNLPGKYECSCLTGFSSPTGNNWIPGKPGHFSCTDINECLSRGVCPEHSECTNSLGSYRCSCKVGFTSKNSSCEDVDECANSRSCPEHSTCHNSVGSYSCVCNPGYVSKSGKKSFQGPGETCQDIDECSQKPPPCGPNSVCRNLPGKYECSCLTGFSSPTGNNWIPGKPGHFSCTDINECLSRGVCPEHSECTNSLGSYRCSCKVGFTSKNSSCEDVDECANSRSCPEHSTCHNSVGSYSCVCNPGYVSKSGKKSFQGPGETCQDIDECSQKPPPCGPNSVCRNLPGKYECSCLTGFSSPTGNNWIPGKPGHFSCTDINECLSRGVCPEHSECTNSLGSYRCSCKVGFTSKNSSCEDVDECANSRSCPEHSTCHNSVGSYSCVCNPGYQSRSGRKSFQGPGEMCEDIDECSQRPPPCGPNSVCRNLPGKYECSCLTGFSSPTGNNWIPGKPGHFSCTDINECLSRGVCPEHSECTNSLGSYRCSCKVGFTSKNSSCEDVDECANPRSCPEHSTCHNSLGNYSCVCNTGYESRSGKKNFQGPGETCEDVDECSRNSALCGPSSICTNVPGKYSCSCLPGFFSPGVWRPEKPGVFKCADIDECLQDPSRCGPNSVCTNTLGSYRCGCIVGFHPNPEDSWKHGNFSCQRIPFKCKDDVEPNNKQVQLCHVGAAVEPKYVSFCALMNATLDVLDNVCKNKTTVVSLKSTAKRFASVIEKTSKWSNFTKEETSTLATVLLESVKSTTLAAFLKPSANVSQTIQTKHLDIESKVIDKECAEENETFKLKAKGDEMKIWCSTIKESESTGINGVAFVSFAGMESILDERFLQDLQYPWANSKKKLKMNSRVVGGIITGGKKDGFSKPVIYTLENIKPKQDFESAICVSWRPEVEGGRWTPSGCVLLEASKTHTVCGCNRMVNLAVIMASGELTMEFNLYLISHVGTIISLVCLATAIITFLVCRTIQNQNTYIHLHLCICLFLAKMLFLTGVDRTDNQMGCALIAGFLHYLFLACFFWMLVEAVILFLMVRNLKVVNYFSSRNIKMLYLCAFGYGLPGLVVAVSAGLQPQGYGMYNRCWLNTETGFIWSFLGPVCTIIVVNSILLTCTLCILRQKLSSVSAEVSTLKDTRLLTFKAFAQIFILGCSWVLGIFQIGPVANIMAYLFTVINSLQGAFIFLIHCLLNRQVREEYRRCMTRKTKPSSETQTSGILLSSVPSTSKTG